MCVSQIIFFFLLYSQSMVHIEYVAVAGTYLPRNMNITHILTGFGPIWVQAYSSCLKVKGNLPPVIRDQGTGMVAASM